MTLIRWNPDGADGADLVAQSPFGLNKAGDATAKYATRAGFQRGNEVGVAIYSGSTAEAQANVTILNTAAATAEIQGYFAFEEWPTPGSLTGVVPFFDMRSSVGNMIRAAINNTGQLTCQNATGGSPGGELGGTLAQLSLNTVYRVQLGCDPGAATTSPFDGFGRFRLFDDNGVLQFDGDVVTGNFGTANPQTLRAGDASTTANGPTGMRLLFTQLGIDTAATMPDIPGVAKNAPPPSSGNYPRVLTASGWV